MKFIIQNSPCAFLQRKPRIVSLKTMLEKVAGSSPTSLRWVLETLVTRTRLGSGRRLRGGAAEVAVRSGLRSTGVFYAGPDPTGIQIRKGVYKMFKLGAIGNCQATGDTKARRKSEASRLRHSPVQQGGGQGDKRQLSWIQRSGGGTHPRPSVPEDIDHFA